MRNLDPFSIPAGIVTWRRSFSLTLPFPLQLRQGFSITSPAPPHLGQVWLIEKKPWLCLICPSPSHWGQGRLPVPADAPVPLQDWQVVSRVSDTSFLTPSAASLSGILTEAS